MHVSDRLVIFFFNDTATTEIYTLSLHDALPICCGVGRKRSGRLPGKRRPGSLSGFRPWRSWRRNRPSSPRRSEEHTSELQSRSDLVCRLLLEKKKKFTPDY